MQEILRLCSIISFTFPSAALADGKEDWAPKKTHGVKYNVHCHKKDPTRCVLQIRAGEKAPFAGILETFPQQALLQVRGDPKEIQKRIDIEVERVEEKAKNDLNLVKKYREIDNRACAELAEAANRTHKKQIKLLEDALPSWHEQPWFVSISTAVGVVAVIGVATLIACELQGCE